MTIDEAISVATILEEADGGCSSCVGHLVEAANELFPQFEWKMVESKNYNISVAVVSRENVNK